MTPINKFFVCSSHKKIMTCFFYWNTKNNDLFLHKRQSHNDFLRWKICMVDMHIEFRVHIADKDPKEREYSIVQRQCPQDRLVFTRTSTSDKVNNIVTKMVGPYRQKFAYNYDSSANTWSLTNQKLKTHGLGPGLGILIHDYFIFMVLFI